jgi:2,3-dihydroxybenzoate decarboxylase
MFAADYPFETVQEAAHFIDTVAIDERSREAIAFGNAVRYFGLPG